MITPASPWIGSTRKATVCGVIASSSALASPNGMILKPGANGPKCSRVAGSVLKPTIPSVRPSQLSAQTMISAPPPATALTPIAPFAHRLDRSLPRLGAAGHRQHLVGAGQLGDLFVERGELVVVEGAGGQRQPARLFHHRGQDLWMAVALVQRRIGGEAIQISVALRVPHPDAFAAR